MEDFKTIARLLAAIKASEKSSVFDMALVNEKVLKTTDKQRDVLAVKLQKAGYIEGLYHIKDVDNLTVPFIIWEKSKPYVTIEGMEWMQTNEALRKAIEELKKVSISIAVETVSNMIQRM